MHIGAKIQARDRFNSFQPDVGPALLRSKSTKVRIDVQGTILTTKTEFESLLSFYYDLLAGGTLPFNWKHPLTGIPIQYKFEAPPERSGVTDDLTVITLKLSYVQ